MARSLACSKTETNTVLPNSGHAREGLWNCGGQGWSHLRSLALMDTGKEMEKGIPNALLVLWTHFSNPQLIGILAFVVAVAFFTVFSTSLKTRRKISTNGTDQFVIGAEYLTAVGVFRRPHGPQRPKGFGGWQGLCKKQRLCKSSACVKIRARVKAALV